MQGGGPGSRDVAVGSSEALLTPEAPVLQPLLSQFMVHVLPLSR